MNVLILSPEQVNTLQQLNAANDSLHQLEPALLADGRAALNPDLLQDCGPGQTWASYHDFLHTLPLEPNGAFPPASV